MKTALNHRVNQTTVATVTAQYVSVTQRDPLDDARNHLVFLTADELRSLLLAVEAA